MSSRSQPSMRGSFNTLAAVLVALVCWKSTTSVSSLGDVCRRDPRPDDELVWNDDPSTVNVTVLWTVELICASTEECFGVSMSTDSSIEHQLVPRSIQRGASLWLQPATYAGATVNLRYYVTDEVGFKSCDFARGRVLPGLDEASPLLLVTPEYLSNNVNYIIAKSSESPFFDCSRGLRLNVTVQDWRCGTGQQTASTACSSHGLCAVRPWATHYECYCCDGFSGEYCNEATNNATTNVGNDIVATMVTPEVFTATENVNKLQQPEAQLGGGSDLMLSMAIVAGLLGFILIVLLILLIAFRCKSVGRRRVAIKDHQRGAYYPRIQLQEYGATGGYYHTGEFSSAHPVPQSPVERDWYWTSESSKSELSTSPMTDASAARHRF